MILETVKKELSTDAGFMITIIGMAAIKINFVCNGQYGTILVSDIYK